MTPTLLPDVTHRLSLFTVEVTLPPDGETREVTLRFEDGVKVGLNPGPGVENGHISDGMFLAPTTVVPRTIILRGGETAFQRGDSNAEDGLDISDPIFILDFLFLGRPKPSCLRSADANDDGSLNIADPVLRR